MQVKIVEAGGIAPLILLLSSESAALQASAARCLRRLASDPDIAARIRDAGALDTLLALLQSRDASAQAAAAEAAGALIGSERLAASAIPHMVKMLASERTQVPPHSLGWRSPGLCRRSQQASRPGSWAGATSGRCCEDHET